MKYNITIGNNLFWFVVCCIVLTVLVQLVGVKAVFIAYVAWELTR